MVWSGFLVVILAVPPEDSGPRPVRVPLSEAGEVDLSELVARVATGAGLDVPRPSGTLRLPLQGLAGALTRQLLARNLGDDVVLTVLDGELLLELPSNWLDPSRRPPLGRGLEDLAARVRRDAAQQAIDYGMHARRSYRPNDPRRPTICLIHGLNSDSSVFVHMVGPLEAAGFGLVAYEFPYNRDLDQTSADFRRDWSAFRKDHGEARPWAVVTHSMGALLVRKYIEAESGYAGDVSSLVMLAPPNGGSALAGAQTVLQFIEGIQAVNGRRAHALALVSDGLGEAADDMTPGSAYLAALNARPRREEVGYHILAGDKAVLDPAARDRVEGQLGLVGSARGPLGGLVRWATGDLRTRLDELTDGLGDGCVSVASTRLEGVDDHRTIHANHLELIRAPLIFPEPGPVVSIPFILDRIGADEASR